MARSSTPPTSTEAPQLFSLRLPRPLWAELSVLATLRDASLNQLICDVVDEWWRTQPEHGEVARLVRSRGKPVQRSGRKSVGP